MDTILLTLFMNYGVPVFGTLIGTGITWGLARAHVNLKVEAERGLRDGLQVALTNAAGLFIAKYGSDGMRGIVASDPRMREAVAYVNGSAGEALKHFDIVNDDTVATKVIAKLGLESMRNTSVTVNTPPVPAPVLPTYPNNPPASSTGHRR